ncbi:ABC transporter ATP-binding protein [Clostridium sp. WLY-B-L2]|jgi:ABC-2 type transport system ATP-binding protein|uniref:ABC transporter ATP-binding protein n=1 Tax=Clostridium aromativorans TaxID=2836848 RepID=A0ABS8N7M0_9CLOT|nr:MULTISPECIES: ABC transporter ATP-binding protein [Clostridium]KAA8677568.1 ABC transporter ATP-binding protein [Clostridium sp. HV4-5-A1G]MCC9295809.1 ABC transporter ATP-binding protein [Clostridium aromativorans]CAB1246687.1 Putative ABC transporter ATP-binding protein YxlF [Clostridiaceae bacterium BL-3]
MLNTKKIKGVIKIELEICNLTKQYKDKTAVDCVNLNVSPGVWGLLGANGAGKTSLIKMMVGITGPTSGKILYDGIEIEVLKEAYRDILGYLPQDFGFYPEFTVVDYLKYVAALKGLTKNHTKIKIDELLQILTLAEVRKKKISKLSGGMKRRVGIAQALLNDPEVLILDEPTSGLDPGERVKFRKFISEFSRDRIVLISTHIVSDVEYIATCNAIMKDGKIISKGTTDELVKTVEGKVWESIIPPERLPYYEGAVRIVNILNEKDGNLFIRYLSDAPDIPDSKQAVPRLEDLYLWLFPQEETRKEKI